MTAKGNELALKLLRHMNPNAPSFKKADNISYTCALIARAATSYARLQVEYCNGHPMQAGGHNNWDLADKLQRQWEKRIEREEPRLEALIKKHVKTLPPVSGKPWQVTFRGDPRGYVVKLHNKANRWLEEVGVE